jgi:hypothetical protein
MINIQDVSQMSKQQKVEYIHEEYYDTQSRGKWTIFNKHKLEIDERSNSKERFLQ